MTLVTHSYVRRASSLVALSRVCRLLSLVGVVISLEAGLFSTTFAPRLTRVKAQSIGNGATNGA